MENTYRKPMAGSINTWVESILTQLDLARCEQLLIALETYKVKMHNAQIAEWRTKVVAQSKEIGLSPDELVELFSIPTVTEEAKRSKSKPRYLNPQRPSQGYTPMRFEAIWFTRYVEELLVKDPSPQQIEKAMKAITNPHWLKTRAAREMSAEQLFALPKRGQCQI